MALMSIDEYRSTCFTKKSKPSPGTVKSWIKKGEVYGKKIGLKYYVDPNITIIVPVDPLVNRILLEDATKKKYI